jgi:hypothetical protein
MILCNARSCATHGAYPRNAAGDKALPTRCRTPIAASKGRFIANAC